MKAHALEDAVKKNAKKLDRKDLSSYEGKYVVFDGTEILTADSYASAMELGFSHFGKKIAFIVRRVGRTPVFSNLVRA